ncbi:hypothetical protein [Patulibacter defluvii]|uniref:hypothetical protein n=1 Tax=Patulibacter defluvii TaxID=3095358 RepID=UPI002A75D635|nr:hypothetical protein [Patulibacter sp. DM4]
MPTRTLVCVDVSQQIALRGVLPWLICGVIVSGAIRGTLTFDTSAILGAAAVGLQFLGHRSRKDSPDG